MTRTHKPKHTFLLRQAVTAGQERRVEVSLHQMQDADGATQVSRKEMEGWGQEYRERRIGMGYTTHDKHIHPHYCNNPPATHQCSLSLSPIFVSPSVASSPSHTHILNAMHFKHKCQCANKNLNSTYIMIPKLFYLRTKSLFWWNIVRSKMFHINAALRLEMFPHGFHIVSSSPIPAPSVVHEKSWGKHW